MGYRSEYADVPAADEAAELDPHFAELARSTSMVPAAYLPAAVAGHQHGQRRGPAWVLIGLIVTVTAGGVCLTYGPYELFRLFER